MKKYRDFYGFTATITEHQNGGAKLVIRDRYGKSVLSKDCKSFLSARITMGKSSDCWNEIA